MTPTWAPKGFLEILGWHTARKLSASIQFFNCKNLKKYTLIPTLIPMGITLPTFVQNWDWSVVLKTTGNLEYLFFRIRIRTLMCGKRILTFSLDHAIPARNDKTMTQSPPDPGKPKRLLLKRENADKPITKKALFHAMDFWKKKNGKIYNCWSAAGQNMLYTASQWSSKAYI